MLSLMRKHAGSWLIKVILGVIVVVFVFWGVGSYRARKESQIAMVNGEAIAVEAYRNAYRQLEEQYRQQFGDAMNQDLLKSLNLKEQALDQLINRRLVLQEAERLGLRVSEDELVQAIQRIPAFGENGRFDSRRYQRMLALNRMTAEMFEAGMREELLVEKMQNIILGSVKVSEAEALERFSWQERQVNVRYAAFKPSDYQDVDISPEAVEAHFSTHQKAYEIPRKVKAAYVRFQPDDYVAEIDITQEEVETHFELNQEEYGTPKKVQARHILFRVEPGATEEVRETARNQAWVVMEQAKSGKDFAELAKQYSDDPGSKNSGGDLGFFTRDRMVKPFSDAAFAMTPGEISEPILTQFGWHVIKVEAVQEAKTPTLSEVKEEIEKKLAAAAAKRMAADRAEAFYDAAYGATRITDVSVEGDVTVHETPFFAESEPVEGIQQGREFARVAFSLEEDQVSEPVALGEGYVILQVVDRQAARIPELAAVAERVREDLARVKAEELARKDAEGFLQAVKGGTEFGAVADALGQTVKETGLFKRSEAVPEIGRERAFVDAAFSLNESKAISDDVIKGRDAYYIVGLVESRAADPKDFEAQKVQIQSRLNMEKRQKRLEDWFTHLRAQGEVAIQKGFLD